MQPTSATSARLVGRIDVANAAQALVDGGTVSIASWAVEVGAPS